MIIEPQHYGAILSALKLAWQSEDIDVLRQDYKDAYSAVEQASLTQPQALDVPDGLLPCPHCGYVFDTPPCFDDLIMDDGGDTCAVVCLNSECSACGPVAWTKINGTEEDAVADAIAAWNHRVTASAQPFPVEIQPPAHVLEQILLDMEGEYSLDTLRYVVYNDADRGEWLQPHSAGVPEPSWEDAPEWAMWWSIEPDGNINWSEQEPQVIFYYWHSEGRHERVIGGFITIPMGVDWRLLKRQRPGAQGEQVE